MQAQVNSNKKVLVIAANTCSSAHYLANQFGATVCALDRGLTQLKSAKATNIDGKKVHYIYANAEHLPIAGNSIDVVWCERALCTLDNLQNALTQIYRVLKPNGFIAISDLFINQTLPLDLSIELSQWFNINNVNSAISQITGGVLHFFMKSNNNTILIYLNYPTRRGVICTKRHHSHKAT